MCSFGGLEGKLVMAITSDEDVLFHWCMMSANDLEDNQVSVLLNKIVEPWVTIRGYSFVSAWVKKSIKKDNPALYNLRK
jgi:hypothetical protein